MPEDEYVVNMLAIKHLRCSTRLSVHVVRAAAHVHPSGVCRRMPGQHRAGMLSCL